jgi:hypothetical protein
MDSLLFPGPKLPNFSCCNRPIDDSMFKSKRGVIINFKRARRDLNPRHPEPESGALSPELRALIFDGSCY